MCSCQCTDGLSATQNGSSAAGGINTMKELNPCLQTMNDQPEPLNRWFISFARKKLYMNRHIT